MKVQGYWTLETSSSGQKGQRKTEGAQDCQLGWCPYQGGFLLPASRFSHLIGQGQHLCWECQHPTGAEDLVYYKWNKKREFVNTEKNNWHFEPPEIRGSNETSKSKQGQGWKQIALVSVRDKQLHTFFFLENYKLNPNFMKTETLILK